MKNAIKYYYNLNPKSIHQINRIYKFKTQNKKYILYPCLRTIDEIKEIYELHMYLNIYGIYCHKIILNINNNIVTQINGFQYILLNINVENRKIEKKDVVFYLNINIDQSRFNCLKRQNWYQLWINKTDYIEYQISQFKKKYPLIKESIDYYIGMAENCISLISNVKNSTMVTISHNRINENTTTEEFYNPLNFIIDYKVRDIAEYLKSLIAKEDITEYIIDYINYCNLTDNDIKLLFIRLLYPSAYFDIYEKIIENHEDESNIISITKENRYYEKNIKKIYNYLRSISNLPEIEWLLE